jgi:hypothetical protein
MSETEVLIGEIRKNLEVLAKIRDFEDKTERDELELLGRTQASAILMAGILENYYTCLETLFLRVSQHFENHLAEGKWHADLLSKMSLAIPGIRERVLSDGTQMLVQELLRFRHFKRYYFELEYDWDKIDFLIKKLKQAHPRVLADIGRFLDFLESSRG